MGTTFTLNDETIKTPMQDSRRSHIIKGKNMQGCLNTLKGETRFRGRLSQK